MWLNKLKPINYFLKTDLVAREQNPPNRFDFFVERKCVCLFVLKDRWKTTYSSADDKQGDQSPEGVIIELKTNDGKATGVDNNTISLGGWGRHSTHDTTMMHYFVLAALTKWQRCSILQGKSVSILKTMVFLFSVCD